MSSSTLLVIPTYWTDATPQPGQAVYDHPTRIGGPQTLTRTLDSLTHLQGPLFRVLILTAVTHPAAEAEAAQQVEALIARYRVRYPVLHVHAAVLNTLRPHLQRLDTEGHVHPTLTLYGYGPVRNLQLVIPHLLGAQRVIALDDDEVVQPEYLTRITAHLGQSAPDGSSVLGLAGFYEDPNGSVYVPGEDEPPTENPYLRKRAIMNAGIQALLDTPGRLVESVMAFGGNMAFTRDLWQQVPFDPWITRGEDLDYLLNARIQGIRWWLDKAAPITHLPPPTPESHRARTAFSKLEQDVRRFVYESEKLIQAGAEGLIETLRPYPGDFLYTSTTRGTLLAAAEQALAMQWSANTTTHPTPAALVHAAAADAQRDAARYLTFARAWPDFMAAVADDAALRETAESLLSR